MPRVPRAGNKVTHFVKCPICGVRRAPWILEGHLRRQHPGAEPPADLMGGKSWPEPLRLPDPKQ